MDSIILITVDSLRYDRFNHRLFPNCQSHFSDFVQFEKTYSHGVATPFAFPGIMSGEPVTDDGSLNRSTPTLAELVNGFSIGFPNNIHLSKHRGYNRGFDNFNDSSLLDNAIETIKHFGRKSELVRNIYNLISSKTNIGQDPDPVPYSIAEITTSQLIDSLENDPDLIWGHYMDPHYPFIPESVPNENLDLKVSQKTIAKANEQFVNDGSLEQDPLFLEENMDELKKIYDAKIRYLDHQLDQLFQKLKRKGMYNDSLIIFVSDHGEAFGNQGIYSHPWNVDPIDELIHTPMVIKYPENKYAGKQISHITQHSDIYALVADKLNTTIETNSKLPLNDTQRFVISKSNHSIRVTSTNGYQIRRKDGSEKESGFISEEARQQLKTASFPEIKLLSGEIPNDKRKKNNIEEQLEALGYK